MFRVRLLLGMLAVTLCFGSGLFGEDKKVAPRVKGTLPTYWSKLGLSDDQKKKVYSTRADYRGKIDELELKIKELKTQERAELEKVLTDAQKARLKELLLEKAPADTKDKKPDTKDKPEKDKKPDTKDKPEKDKKTEPTDK